MFKSFWYKEGGLTRKVHEWIPKKTPMCTLTVTQQCISQQCIQIISLKIMFLRHNLVLDEETQSGKFDELNPRESLCFGRKYVETTLVTSYSNLKRGNHIIGNVFVLPQISNGDTGARLKTE